MMPDTISSDTSWPASITALALSPTGVPDLTAARNMSPVESCTMPRVSSSRLAWVPLPAPGAPSKMIFMANTLPVDALFNAGGSPSVSPSCSNHHICGPAHGFGSASQYRPLRLPRTADHCLQGPGRVSCREHVCQNVYM